MAAEHKQIKLTQEGFERLQRSLEQEQGRLAEATRILQEQMEASADFEDTGLEDAKREKVMIEARIEEFEDTLARATLITGDEHTGKVELGSVLVLYNEATKQDMKVQLVSAPEATIRGGSLPKISDDSPVGRELLGRKKGESFVVNLDSGKQMKYKIKSLD